MSNNHEINDPVTLEDHAAAHQYASLELLRRADAMDIPQAGMLFAALSTMAGAVAAGYVETARKRVTATIADQPEADVLPFRRG